ncbi:MAG TPA: BTAD domain-containing putative transcriptional regulator [Gaiellales bacterium]|jgi:DNA-binding SARP family transcriptional activator/ABC-type branched-subunit amino acid transport system substrate-binding protein/DNA-binding beta-propeller fold protein YncE|nr:BTAD domain-containing putative transcriptional regulator [Gaiellales bacterium]
MEPLTFGILGPLQAHRGTESLPVGSGRQAELMALLVTRRNTAVPTERLIDDLWDGRPPDTAAKIVQNAVSGLRRALGDESGAVLVTQGRGYMLVTPAGGTDVDRAAELLEQGRAELAAGNADGAARTLRAALALWRGPPLPEVAYRSFARDEIARLDELRLVVLEERIAADLARGERAELVPELEQLVARHPLREGFRGQLMLALYRAGRQARALQVYSEGRIALSEELGIEPGENLKRLERAILDHDPDLDGPSRPRALPVVRGRERLALAAGAILLAAAAAAAVWMSQSGAAPAVTVGGNSIGLIDPASGRILADFPAGDAPSKVVTTGDAAWALSENDGTVTRMDLTTGRRRTYRLTAGRAADMVLGGGWLWISVVGNAPAGNGATADVVRLDPDTMTDEGTVPLPGAGAVGDPAPLAYSAGEETLWAAAFGDLSAINPITRRRTPAAHDVDAGALASGLGAVWATPAESSDPRLSRIDPATGRVQRIALPVQSTGSLAVAGDAVWVADPLSGDVWRVDPAAAGWPQRIPVGMSALGVSPAGTGVWVADGVSGTIARISSHDGRLAVDRFPIGETPRSVAAGTAGALVAVAPGGGPPALTGSVPLHGLPSADCGPLLHGTGEPQRLIAADFQLGGVLASATLPMRQAIVYTLRQRDFRAGSYRVGFQACDDTGEDGYWDGQRCASNARRFAHTPELIGLIGPFNSGCAKEELALLNRAGPLAVISPSASYPGFTHAGPGTRPGEPAIYRPSGVTGFARVIPSDDMEGIALGQLAIQLGLRHVYVYRNPDNDYSAAVGAAFARTARSAGIRVLDSPSYAWRADLGRRLRDRGFDGVVIADTLDTTTGRIIRETGKGSPGRPLTLLAGAFIMVAGGDLADAVGERGTGMYVAWEGVSNPLRQLPPAGTRFARTFSATQPNADIGFYTPYAAQAAEVLLKAIASSDGSRASVSRELLRVRIRDGILGPVQFASNGDMTINRLPILRFNSDAPYSPSVYQLIRVAPAAD